MTSRVTWFTAILALAVGAGAAAQPVAPVPASGQATAPSGAPADPVVLAPAFDAYFGPESGNAYTGAVAVVVRDGAVVLSKGYGFEDAARTRRVSPSETRFRLGSITKTLVAVHLAALMERGVVRSLDDPVNEYLTRLTVPDNAGVPITLRMLATHQAGFAEARQPFMRPGDRFPEIDGAYIRRHLPGFVVPPTSGANYSNFGIALLEYAMEDAGGQSLDAFAASQVFGRAGMKGALLVTEPRAFPRGAQAELLFPDGAASAIPDEWANHPLNKAAGAMAATGEDMGRYMVGLLGGSEVLGVPDLLSDRARETVFHEQGATHPLVQKYGVVFMLNDWNGVHLAEHGGRTLGTSSYLTLLPDRRTGVFVAATGERGVVLPVIGGLPGNEAPVKRAGARSGARLPWLGSLRAIALEAMLGPYRPAAIAVPAVTVNLAEYAGQYVGQRRPLRSSSQWLTALILGGPLDVAPDGKGGLRIGRTPGYLPIGKDVFWRDSALEPKRPSGWSDLFVFRRDRSGAVADGSFLYTDVVYRRADGATAPAAIQRTLGWSALAVLTGLLSFVWARGSIGRVRAALAALVLVLTPVVFFLSWPRAKVLPLAFVWLSRRDLAVYQVWLLAAGLLLVSLIGAAIRSRGVAVPPGWRGRLGRAHLWSIALAAVPLLWAAWMSGMIGWNLD